MNKHSSRISVIMAVYNCEKTIEEAIQSIFAQTYSDWKLIICDDGSTDRTYEILADYNTRYPDRVKIIKNEKNYRQAYSLNRCLLYAENGYVARMDGDDRSAADRFQKQVDFLRWHPDVDLVGTAMRRFDKNGLADMIYPVESPDKFTLRKRAPFLHGTIMTYKYVYDAVQGYTVARRTERAQDY